jgi:hypothetical protein
MQSEPSGHVLRATLDREALTGLLAERFGSRAIAIVRRIDGAEFVPFDAANPGALPEAWTEGQLFDEGAEVRWRARDDTYEVLLLTERADSSPDFQELRESPFDVVIPSPEGSQGFMLWGTRLSEGTWYEARIPRRLVYPIATQRKLRLDHRLYERNATVCWVRLCGLKEEERG